MPVEYNVLLNAGSIAPLTSSVGHHQSILLENLAPFTQYEIRIQACQNGKSLSDTCPGLLLKKKVFYEKIFIKKE